MATVFCGWIRVVKRRGRGSSFVGSTFSWDLIHNEGQVALGTGLVSVNWTITNIFWFNYLTLVDLIRRMLT